MYSYYSLSVAVMMTGETLTPRATPLYMKPCVHFFIETLSLETKAQGINRCTTLSNAMSYHCLQSFVAT